jgi:hypothetical protein
MRHFSKVVFMITMITLIFMSLSPCYAKRQDFLGGCGEFFLQARDDQERREAASKALEKIAVMVREQKQLFGKEVHALIDTDRFIFSVWSRRGDPYSANWDVQKREVPPDEPIVQYAYRIDAISSRLSSDQWTKTVDLWAAVLTAGAKCLYSARHQTYPGPLESIGIIIMDATRIIWVPLLYPGLGQRENGSILKPMGKLIIGAVPSVVSDVGFSIPSSVMKARYQLSIKSTIDKRALDQSMEAFRNYIEGLESAMKEGRT